MVRSLSNFPALSSIAPLTAAKESEELHLSTASLSLRIAAQNIQEPTCWEICREHPTIVVHLGGYMAELQTEVEGFGGSRGPATVGEIWTIPARASYMARARGDYISYAVLVISEKITLGNGSAIRDSFIFNQIASAREICKRDSWEEAKEILISLESYLKSYALKGLIEDLNGEGRVDVSYKINSLKDYIFDNLSETIMLDDLASLAEMTAHELLIYFRATFGTTPMQFIIKQRLRRATWFLLHSKKEISEIAYLTGFSSHSHLTATFNRKIGMSPSRFRGLYS